MESNSRKQNKHIEGNVVSHGFSDCVPSTYLLKLNEALKWQINEDLIVNIRM